MQSQVLTAGGATGGHGWRSLHSHQGRFVDGMKLNWNQRSCYSLMPKKVCVMCFFLPQVHRHKAQAQFPSFNRAARNSLFVCLFVLFFFKKMSQCKKQVGWPPPRFQQLTSDISDEGPVEDVDLFYNFPCCQGCRRKHGRDYAGKHLQSSCEIKTAFTIKIERFVM